MLWKNRFDRAMIQRALVSASQQSHSLLSELQTSCFEAMVTEKHDSALKQIPSEKAFYFYTGLGNYTGKSAASLKEFAQRINEVDEKSLRFHLERGDFENWISSVLKDEELAKQMKQLRGTNLSGPELRNRFSATISQRLEQQTRLSNVKKASGMKM